MWNAYCLFSPEDFLDLCDEIRLEWMLPRTGNGLGNRKHPIEAQLFATIGMLSTGLGHPAMEGLVEINAGLLCIEFARNLLILDKVLDYEMELLNEEEKSMCQSAAKSHPYICYYVDGCDFALRIGLQKWMYLTTKKNIKNRTAIRAQILIDSLFVVFIQISELKVVQKCNILTVGDIFVVLK